MLELTNLKMLDYSLLSPEWNRVEHRDSRCDFNFFYIG